MQTNNIVSAQENWQRSISEAFLERFKSGNLKNLKKLIDKNGRYKSRFMLNLRGNRVIIYYKGLRALTIYDAGDEEKQQIEYEFECTKEYVKDTVDFQKLGVSLVKENTEKIDVENNEQSNINFCMSDEKLYSFDWNYLLNGISEGIDLYNLNIDNAEKEAQQRIWFENNIAREANSTEYIIVDTEYKERGKKNGGRFDLWALYWPNHNAAKPVKLVCIELKYGAGAVGDSKSSNGKDKKQSSLNAHLKDFQKFIEEQKAESSNENKYDFYKDISTMFCQLYDLEMIDMNLNKDLKQSIENGYSEKCKKIVDKKTPVQMMFILANYKPKSKILSDQIISRLEQQSSDSNSNIEVVFARASFSGYGLYGKYVIGIEDMPSFLNITEETVKEYHDRKNKVRNKKVKNA